MKKALLVLLLLLSTTAFALSAKQAMIQNAINRHEKNILAALKRKNASQNEIFRTYVLAANEMKAYNSYKFAGQFYYKAIDLEGVTIDKSRLFYSLIDMDLLEGNDGKKHFEELKNYQRKNKKSNTLFNRVTTAYYKVLLSGKTSKEVLTQTQLKEIEKDFKYVTPLKWHDIHTFVQRKEFSRALKLISSMDMNRAPINQKIISDFITVRTEKKSNKSNPLHCEYQFNKYPGSQSKSYTMKLCKILLDERFGKGLNPTDLDKLSQLIEKKAPTQKFLIDALK